MHDVNAVAARNAEDDGVGETSKSLAERLADERSLQESEHVSVGSSADALGAQVGLLFSGKYAVGAPLKGAFGTGCERVLGVGALTD
jgi:hypothetical protein